MKALAALVLALAGFTGACAGPRDASKRFDLDEVTIAELQERMRSGRASARSLAEEYLARIERVDDRGPELHAVITTNPDALAIADALDRERRTKGPRGPLHGIPILVKDNLATGDRMPTTAGSLALEGCIAPDDAFVVKKLRDAGCVILGKTNLSEWANFRSTHSSSGWSAVGGQTKNPYALDRNPSGSSSGTAAAIAANLAAIGVGTETDGSIVSPSNNCMLVGVKPTVGLVSRSGIVPISHTQDTAGPMARTVTDAALLLGAMAGSDPDDPATSDAAAHARDYAKELSNDALRGARVGVVRAKLTGYDPAVDAVFERAIADLRRLGAVVVDPADVPTIATFDAAELDVLLYEFKADLERYLAWLGPRAKLHTLAELVAFDREHADREMPHFAQELFEMALAKGPLTERAYVDAVEHGKRLAGPEGIDATMDRLQLDALVAPTGVPAWPIDLEHGDASTMGSSSLAAVAGYPHVTVPMGDVRGLPVGLSFFGRAWGEGELLRLAYAYEQGTRHREKPSFAPTIRPDPTPESLPERARSTP